mmetsp:Transcript_26467/g.58181  ORF Transcript_26467/g.58181 Transcript_26467/m.58181 type:complete len:127 (+) Transcript_26467:3-383(+)
MISLVPQDSFDSRPGSSTRNSLAYSGTPLGTGVSEAWAAASLGTSRPSEPPSAAKVRRMAESALPQGAPAVAQAASSSSIAVQMPRPQAQPAQTSAAEPIVLLDAAVTAGPPDSETPPQKCCCSLM